MTTAEMALVVAIASAIISIAPNEESGRVRRLPSLESAQRH
jgi:hypothetical protein